MSENHSWPYQFLGTFQGVGLYADLSKAKGGTLNPADYLLDAVAFFAAPAPSP